MPLTDSEIALQRFTAMGISARVMPDGQCVIASMPLGKAPFPGPAGPQRFQGVLFSALGVDRIKCLKPRALFQLPIISIKGCRDPASIEGRIRSVWEKHTAEITRTRQWLRGLGTEASPTEGGSALQFPIEGEDLEARACMIDRHRVVLPSRGPLKGMSLDGPEERVMEIGPNITSGLSLDIAVSARLKELSHRASRGEDERRLDALSIAPAIVHANQNIRGAHHILAVGPRIAQEQACIASLRLRGYNVTVVASHQEAAQCFGRVSPELVLADIDLGRSDGIELILALRDLAGIEDLPVILVDDHSRPAKREAARLVGAAGYIIYPIDVSRIDKQLSSLITSPRLRRFTRYSSHLPVVAAGSADPLLASALGRGGMYLTTPESLDLDTVNRYRLSLPDVGHALEVDAQVIYTAEAGVFRGLGAGMRFRDFPGSNEELLIQYLCSLEKAQSGA